jgi:hypothetical protein
MKGDHMAKSLIDEIHVSIYVPKTQPASETAAVVTTLKGKPFNLALNAAVRAVFGRYQSLRRCIVKLSR